MTATERRTAAIADIIARFLNEKHMLRQDIARTDITAAIQALKPLGRTARWTDALNGWAAMVDQHPLDMDWALLQGQIFALHAA